MPHDVVVRERPAILVVSKRLPVRIPEMGATLQTAFGEVYGALGARGVATEGPPFVIYHQRPVEDEPFDIEICAPVARRTDPPAGWRMQELPAGSFASLEHVGPYDTIGEAYERLLAWVSEHGSTVSGPPREAYLSGPGTEPERIRTIVELPIVAHATRAPAG